MQAFEDKLLKAEGELGREDVGWVATGGESAAQRGGAARYPILKQRLALIDDGDGLVEVQQAVAERDGERRVVAAQDADGISL